MDVSRTRGDLQPVRPRGDRARDRGGGAGRDPVDELPRVRRHLLRDGQGGDGLAAHQPPVRAREHRARPDRLGHPHPRRPRLTCRIGDGSGRRHSRDPHGRRRRRRPRRPGGHRRRSRADRVGRPPGRRRHQSRHGDRRPSGRAVPLLLRYDLTPQGRPHLAPRGDHGRARQRGHLRPQLGSRGLGDRLPAPPLPHRRPQRGPAVRRHHGRDRPPPAGLRPGPVRRHRRPGARHPPRGPAPHARGPRRRHRPRPRPLLDPVPALRHGPDVRGDAPTPGVRAPGRQDGAGLGDERVHPGHRHAVARAGPRQVRLLGLPHADRGEPDQRTGRCRAHARRRGRRDRLPRTDGDGGLLEQPRGQRRGVRGRPPALR